MSELPPPICGFAQHDMELLHAGDGDRALGYLRLALRRAEELAAASAPKGAQGEAAYDVARGYDGVGDDANAESWYARALAVPAYRASPAWPHACPSLALRYLWRGDFERAEPLAGESVEHARTGRALGQDALVMALVTQGQALIGLGRHREAIPVLDEAVRLAGASEWMRQFRGGFEVDALTHLARAHATLGDVDAAFHSLDEAERLSATWTTRARLDVLLASAEARRAAGRRDEAAERARLAVAWWDAMAAHLRESGGAAAEAERARDALAAAWGV
jgi:tetratricopeptide (TPR) repeat protein